MQIMVTESELAERIHDLLRSSDLKKTTNNTVKRKLESDFGIDLSDKKPFLRLQVERFLQTHYDLNEQDGYDDDDDDDDDDVTHDRFDDGNDDVSGSEDDRRGPGLAGVVQVNSNNTNNINGSNSLKPIIKIKRPAKLTKEKIKKKSGSGKFCTLSPQLQKFVGVPTMLRTEVVQKLWSYVRENNLQDPLDGKTIKCDETLRDLLGVDSINILQINKALAKHIWRSASSRSIHKEKKQKQDREEPDGAENMKLHKKVYSGFLAPLPLSDSLMKFLGTEESALTRAVVIKRVWEYIKAKKLQDPSDKKTVICDEKMRELFNIDSFQGFLVSKLLTPHFVKT